MDSVEEIREFRKHFMGEGEYRRKRMERLLERSTRAKKVLKRRKLVDHLVLREAICEKCFPDEKVYVMPIFEED